MKQLNLNNLDGLIWDMDGVLVDVSQSYREAIRKTAENILQRIVSTTEIDEVKNIVGMNNDWDATYALVYGVTDFKKINRSTKQYKEVYDIFQKLYLGDSKNIGLIDVEKLFIDKPTLEKLKNKYTVMAIATGRPRYELDYALKKNNLEKIFDLTVAMEDTEKGKPFPDPILKVIQSLELKNTVYIGDSPSDTVAAKNAEIPSIYIGAEKLGNLNFATITNCIEFLL